MAFRIRPFLAQTRNHIIFPYMRLLAYQIDYNLLGCNRPDNANNCTTGTNLVILFYSTLLNYTIAATVFPFSRCNAESVRKGQLHDLLDVPESLLYRILRDDGGR